ncbi:hypothetical protein TIFTF001_032429 [Ficus carica]|uniref:Small auxin up regulated protein n=1 Tax=Ficus carica TaxID=3494 RepID=A0AA88E0C6_FICCA|nr:hypothetical protein TIFTF001_032429 [Ficus carica]
MGFCFPQAVNAKKILQRSLSNASQTASPVPDVPKRYLAVYVGDGTDMKRFVIPVSYLNKPTFQELLSQAEEEYGFDVTTPHGPLQLTSYLIIHLL